jgi:hypothetical protein
MHTLVTMDLGQITDQDRSHSGNKPKIGVDLEWPIMPRILREAVCSNVLADAETQFKVCTLGVIQAGPAC